MSTNNLRDPLAASLAPDRFGIGMAGDTFQAFCNAWDPVTFENSIGYSAATFTNLPVLNAAAMRTGYVLLGRSGSGNSLVILGPLDWFTP